MEHAEAREILELAAVEPDGLARLMAGDTPESGLLASHLAGCDECTAEMARLRREAGILRGVMRTTPPADLRDRTLALVRAVGRDRSGMAAATPAGVAVAQAPIARPTPLPDATPRPAPRRRIAWQELGAIAAAIVVAVLGTAFVVGSQRDGTIAQRDATIAAQARVADELADVAASTVRVASRPDAQNVALTATSAGNASGAIIFSKADRELIVTATGLAKPDAMHEYRCWMEVDGRREVVGKMFFGGGLAYWVGPVAALADAPADASFGVSLVDLTTPTTPGQPFLVGKL